MAEHHKAPQPPLLLQALKAQQGPQGFAGAWAGVDQHIAGAVRLLLQPAPQQLDQLALPLARPQLGMRPARAVGGRAQVEGG